MEVDIYAGKRVLYKNGNSGWLIGTIYKTKNAEVNEQGVWIPIIPIGMDPEKEIHWAEINQIYTNATKITEDWIKDYKQYYMTKEEYINFIESDDFHKSIENAAFSDGEYIYYPVSKYNRNWIEKQPFDYVVRSD